VVRYAYRLREPSLLHYVLPWLLYFLHQGLHLRILYKAFKEQPAYSSEWRWFNWAQLKLHGVFLCLKYLQTWTTYDGMAAHLPLAWGVATVASFLFVVYTMHVPTRGIIFGYGTHIKAANGAALFLRKYHAFFFSFAILNDFWYHPFESTAGHMLGILNDILMLWQSIFIYTHSHRNTYWMLILEIIVLPHSGLIAIDRGWWSGNGSAGAFSFGYFIFLLLNQMHGPKMNLSKLQKFFLFLVFLLGLCLTYGLRVEPSTKDDGKPRKGFEEVAEIFQRMPLICFMFIGIHTLMYKCCGECSRRRSKTVQVAAGTAFFVVPFLMTFGAFLGLFSLASRQPVAPSH
jgi:hypothetical protein